MKFLGLLFCLLSVSLTAQKQLPEFGVFGGGIYYVGDLNPYVQYKCTHFGGGLLYRKNINTRIALRLSANYGLVSGADSLNNLEIYKNRNLHFKSNIIELGGMIEFNYTKYKPGDIKKDRFTPYLYTGLLYFNMSPRGYLNGDWYDLQGLGTEGQGSSLNSDKHYSLNQVAIPFGIGIKGNLTKRICISFEYGLRKTFTDYLDDVSGHYVNNNTLREENGTVAAYFADQSIQKLNGDNEGALRGNPNNKDWYSFSGMIITIVLGKPTTCSFKKG